MYIYYMDYITTTDLRTKSSLLIKTLKKGTKVSLVHRSKVVGVISPKEETITFTKESIKKLKELAKKQKLPDLSYEERDRIYRKQLEKKYGKGIS